jgi:hypothetical protein
MVSGIRTISVRWRNRSVEALAIISCLLVSATLCMAEESMHAGIEKYEGTKTCLECHDTLAKEVALSLHYQLQAEPQQVEGWEKGKPAGMLADFSPEVNTTAGHNWLGVTESAVRKVRQPDGCGRCHIGLGAKPNPPDKIGESDYDNIDCLICHAPGYERTVVKETIKAQAKGRKGEEVYKLAPSPGMDLLKAVRSVKKPTSEMCLRCHAFSCDGGKDGSAPSMDGDLHLTMGMSCTECHTTKQHKIAGGAHLKAREMGEVKVGCENCHTEAPHKGEKSDYLNRHVSRIACQVCHIPVIARDLPTLTERDWTKPAQDGKTGLFVPTSKSATAVKPEYLWWNGALTVTGEPVGAKRDRKSKIFSWKRTRYTLIADSAGGQPVPIKSALYSLSGDTAVAAMKGALEAKQPYSGQWKGVQDSTLATVNHNVADKSESLQCDVCHSENTILDFKALGMRSPRRK